jgi:hypothetical protein
MFYLADGNMKFTVEKISKMDGITPKLLNIPSREPLFLSYNCD